MKFLENILFQHLSCKGPTTWCESALELTGIVSNVTGLSQKSAGSRAKSIIIRDPRYHREDTFYRSVPTFSIVTDLCSHPECVSRRIFNSPIRGLSTPLSGSEIESRSFNILSCGVQTTNMYGPSRFTHTLSVCELSNYIRFVFDSRKPFRYGYDRILSVCKSSTRLSVSGESITALPCDHSGCLGRWNYRSLGKYFS